MYHNKIPGSKKYISKLLQPLPMKYGWIPWCGRYQFLLYMHNYKCVNSQNPTAWFTKQDLNRKLLISEIYVSQNAACESNTDIFSPDIFSISDIVPICFYKTVIMLLCLTKNK